jgi:hypothetical protein
VNDPAGSPLYPNPPPPEDEADVAPSRRSRWSTFIRIAFEFALLFAIALAARQALTAVAGGSYPNPLWLPVIVLSLQHGMAAGLGAAIIAAGIQYSDGLPPALMSEDMYAYIGRVAAEPVGWCCVALLLGHIRSRQIANTAELEAELAERRRQCAAVADLCADLRSRTELLERHIAANAHASNSDIVEAMTALNQATWDDFAERLTRFVDLMTGATDFSVYLLRNERLELAFQPKDDHRLAGATAVAASDPVFGAIVNERRLLSVARPADAALLGNRWMLAAPLPPPRSASPQAGEDTEGTAERVIGMFAIAGTALEDHAEDIERRFLLTCGEIARLVGCIVVIDSWHAAQPSHYRNGSKLADEVPRASPASPHARPAPAAQAGKGRERTLDAATRGERGMTLQ